MCEREAGGEKGVTYISLIHWHIKAVFVPNQSLRDENIKSLCVNMAVNKKSSSTQNGHVLLPEKVHWLLFESKNIENTRYSGTMIDSSLKYPNASKFTYKAV